MSEYAIENNPKDYELFINFKDKFLINKVSIFDENLEVITEENLNQFEERFIINYIAGGELNFLEKSKKQLGNSSKSFKHLFCNYLWLYNFFFSSVNRGGYDIDKAFETKIKEIRTLINENFNSELIPKIGYANCGISYKTRKDVEMCYIHIFVKHLFYNPTIIYDKEQLIDFIYKMNVNTDLDYYVGANVKKAGIKNILLYLLFPKDFEPIVSFGDKEKIVNGFGRISLNKNIDENLKSIREKSNILNSFYDVDNIHKWQDVDVIRPNEQNTNNNKLKVTKRIKKTESSTSNKFDLLNHNDLKNDYEEKLIAGQEAEDIVYSELSNKYMSKEKLNGTYVKNILFAIENIYGFEVINSLRSKKLKEISMFSKFIHTKAPFDIIYTNNATVKFVEVKSCKSKPYKIYMSINELFFAYENIDNYELKVVIDNIVYDVEPFPIEDLYNEVCSINNNGLLSISQFEIDLDLE